jgi:formylglycine-generating enzyme required for sulfatase activity
VKKLPALIVCCSLLAAAFIFSILLSAINAQAEQKELKPGTIKTVDIGGGIKMDFVWCPPGSFMMGSATAEQNIAIKALPADLKPETRQSTIAAIQNEGPQHEVVITKGFWMAKTEVTQSQWKRVMGKNPSKFIDSGPDAPVETVSWKDCQELIKKLNRMCAEKAGGWFGLPTEAEWEYACRAGSQTAYYFDDDASILGDYAWYAANSSMKTHTVALKLPNAWGLYDMHGNVWEWCSSWFGKYKAEDAADPKGPVIGSVRVGRGGGWDDFEVDLRAAYRSFGRTAAFKASPLGCRPVIKE